MAKGITDNFNQFVDKVVEMRDEAVEYEGQGKVNQLSPVFKDPTIEAMKAFAFKNGADLSVQFQDARAKGEIAVEYSSNAEAKATIVAYLDKHVDGKWHVDNTFKMVIN
jgi:hypothetical protein